MLESSPSTSAPSGGHGCQGRSASERLAALTLGAIGVVYGDIGTSPLYALRECLHGHSGIGVNTADILGILSLICWSLVCVVSIKYLAFVMRADNRGEGGILALMALVHPRPKRPAGPRPLLVVLGVFGAALLYGDGMITPAISVLSAVEGIEIAAPQLHPYIVPITVLILVAIFVVQRQGTARVGAVFGPITLVWFLTMAALGVAAIWRQPQVFAAISPRHAVDFFQRHGRQGLMVLGSVFLVVTGAEALYADMGHFGRRPIRLAWFALVFPCLLLNYLGQGALLLRRPEAIENPFFYLVPRWALYPTVALATIATVIASQAIISGAFSLSRQAVRFGYFPRLQILHTSEDEMGQVYVPAVNWALLLASVALVLEFRSSSSLAAAYGVAVTSTMVITTLLALVVARRLWHWGWPRILALGVLFIAMDLAFLSGNVVKIPDGGWFPLLVGLIGYALMSTWRQGRELLAERLKEIAVPFAELLRRIDDAPPAEVSGTAIFLSSDPDGVPPTLLHNLRHNKILHERIVFLTIVTEEVPRVPPKERVQIEQLGERFCRVAVRYGFMQEPHVPTILRYCALQGLTIDVEKTTFFLGRETLLATSRPGMSIWREKLFAFMSRNANGPILAFHIPPNRVVELGAQIEL